MTRQRYSAIKKWKGSRVFLKSWLPLTSALFSNSPDPSPKKRVEDLNGGLSPSSSLLLLFIFFLSHKLLAITVPLSGPRGHFGAWRESRYTFVGGQAWLYSWPYCFGWRDFYPSFLILASTKGGKTPKQGTYRSQVWDEIMQAKQLTWHRCMAMRWLIAETPAWLLGFESQLHLFLAV